MAQINGLGLEYLPSHFLKVSPGAKIKILQSCHELLLCKLTYASVVVNCVCNQPTRKYKVIPPPSLLPTQLIFALSLAFDPSESLHYRLACVKHVRFYIDGGWTRNLEVYSSETGSWRSTSCSFHRLDSARFENAFYWNGTIHWVRHEVSYRCLFDDFNIETEELEILYLPPKPRSDCNCKWSIRYFGQSRGYWHIIYIRSLSAYQFNVLEMDDETFKWSVKYRVNIYCLLSAFRKWSVVRALISIGMQIVGTEYMRSRYHLLQREKMMQTRSLFLLFPGKVVSYNFKRKTYKVLRELPSEVVDSSTFGFINSHQFVDSLCSVSALPLVLIIYGACID